MAYNKNSLANIGKGRPPTGRKQVKVSLLPSAVASLKKLHKNRGEAIERSLQLNRIAYALLKDSEDPQAMAWCDEVEPILSAESNRKPVIAQRKSEDIAAWIV